MKKIIVILIIISILTVNLRTNFVLAQDNNQIDFSSYYLQCKIPEHIKVEELETATETVEYISEFENFSGLSEPSSASSFLESLLKGFIGSLLTDLANQILSSLLGKVPVGASEVNADIRNSIKESTKNVLASIKASIQLSIKDTLEYFKFKLINKVNDLIYGKILKNYLSDINLYRNFRLFLAQQKAINRVLNKYKNLPCIPDDFKWCFVSILKNNSLIGVDLASQSENANKLIKYVNAFMKLQELNILGKRSCEPEEEKLVYENLGLEEPIYEEALSSWGEGGSVYAAFNTKPKNLITKIEAKPRNVFANIFSLINPKVLLAQFYPSQDFGSYGKIFFPFIEKINTEINLRNCSYLISRDLAIINAELEKEKERLGIQFQQPGGFTFKPKTECLKTWAEVEREEVMRQLDQARDKEDTQKIERLNAALKDLEQRISQQKDITGEDPRCLIPGPTISAPSDYERLKEQILTSPLEFFKSQERAANTLVAFIRSWLSTKLFKILDKGFASLESRKTKSEVITDITKAYEEDRIKKICDKTESVGVRGVSQICRQTLESQKQTIGEILKNDVKDLSLRLRKILLPFKEVISETDNFHNTITALIDYIENNNLNISEDKLIELGNIAQQIDANKKELDDINNNFSNSSSTINQLIGLQLNTTTITELQEDIDAITKEMENLEKSFKENTQRVNSLLSEAYNLGFNSKLTTFFSNYPNMSLLIKNSYRCEPFPRDYIFYYDEPQGYEGYKAGGVCNYYSTYPTLGNKINLTFHKNFYSTHLMDVNDLNYEWIKRRYDESQADLIYDRPFKLYHGYENRYVSAYLIAHDLLIILYSLYGQDETSINSNSFMNSLNTHISNLASVNIDINRKQEFVNEIKNVLIPYFDKLEKFSIYLIGFTKNNTTPAGTLLYDFNFTYSSGRGSSVSLNTGEILEHIKKLSSLYKEILNIIIKMYTEQDSDIIRYGKLKQRLLDLNKQLEEEQNKALDELLSKLSSEEINAIYSSLENNVEKINDIMDSNYILCQEYNDLLKDIEEELKSAPPEANTSLPESETEPETESYKIQKETKFSLIKRAFDITKNLIASIFNVFNIFKPKKIYIK
jgi:hypothetical protein